MKEYSKITSENIKKLRDICTDNAVIYEDDSALQAYSHDEAGGSFYAHMPQAVVKPCSSEQVSQIVRFAAAQNIPLTPRGAGSGLAGACVPLYGGIVLSLERMNRILEIDTQNMVAVVEPGVVTNDLCKKAQEKGLYYAGYPMSVHSSFIGGNVATNAGGSKVIKYGNTSHHVLGLEVVLPDGSIVQYGGKRRKDSSGYDMVHLFIGSEGTLGVITKIFLNLVPLPGMTVDLMVPFGSLAKAISAIEPVIRTSSVLPSAVEFLDSTSVKYSCSYNNMELPFMQEAQAYMIVQFEAENSEQAESLYEKAGKLFLDMGALDVYIADNRNNSEKIWRIRRNWLESLKAIDPNVPTGDVVVPISEIPAMVEYIKAVGRKYGADIPVAGHAADGNLHPAPLNNGSSCEQWREVSEKILSEIAIKACELGGAVSGEHGIGFVKKDLLLMTKKTQIESMLKIKKSFDPNNIMNPGKLYEY